MELDKVMEPVCKLVNDCYEACFPDLPQFPKFSFTRAMITLWKAKVYAKIESNLAEAFVTLLHKERQAEIKLGEQKTNEQKHVWMFNRSRKKAGQKGKDKSHSVSLERPVEEEAEEFRFLNVHVGMGEEFAEEKNWDLIALFVQCVADLSINELKIHFLGSTKVDLDEPYKELNKIIIKQTK